MTPRRSGPPRGGGPDQQQQLRFTPLGGREQAAAQAVSRGDTPAPRQMRLRGFRPLVKVKLMGFVSVEPTCGLVLHDLPVFIGRDSPWVVLPPKLLLDGERRRKLDANGQPSFQAVAEWHGRDLADRFSAAVIELVRQKHPGALDGESE